MERVSPAAVAKAKGQAEESAARDEKLNALAVQAGFPPEFEFALYARSAIDAYKAVQQIVQDDRLIQKSTAQITSAAASIDKAVRKLHSVDPRVAHVLGLYDTDHPEDLLHEDIRRLELLSYQLRKLKAETVPAGSGRKSEPGLDFLIRELYSLFRDFFPNEKGYSRKDEAKNGYKGRFFELMCLLFAELEIKRTPLAAGKAIERSLEGYDP